MGLADAYVECWTGRNVRMPPELVCLALSYVRTCRIVLARMHQPGPVTSKCEAALNSPALAFPLHCRLHICDVSC